MNKQSYFESNYKRIGLIPISEDTCEVVNHDKYKAYIKVLYLPAGSSLTVDFKHYQTALPSLFFINSNQYAQLESMRGSGAYFIYYNRDFYCIHIHDAEVACDGLLFNNVYQMPMTELPADENEWVQSVFQQIAAEFEMNASSQEEMIRTYLKQLIIRATRVWKKQRLGKLNEETHAEVEFFRDFSRMVEIHYRDKHTVADYADLIGVASKTLSNKFKRLGLPQPNEIIKDRIMLEAKRLLMYSSMSVKEIAYDLGYDDPAYFNRLFAAKVGETPAAFKRIYTTGLTV